MTKKKWKTVALAFALAGAAAATAISCGNTPEDAVARTEQAVTHPTGRPVDTTTPSGLGRRPITPPGLGIPMPPREATPDEVKAIEAAIAAQRAAGPKPIELPPVGKTP
jgi:hypothetical protein